MKYFKDLIGKKVSHVDKGYGSFFDIYFDSCDVNFFRLWIYDTKWALTVEGVELVSSDDVNEFNFSDVSNALSGKRLREIEVLDEMELHMEFDGNVFIEFWIDGIDIRSLGAVLRYNNNLFLDKILYPLKP